MPTTAQQPQLVALPSPTATDSLSTATAQPTPDTRPILFFDIDNCLYPRSANIQNLMQSLIDSYFTTHLSLSPSDAMALHKKYYTEYGLALSGLVKHHKISPLEYNAQVDDALPLDEILSVDERLQGLLGRLKEAGKVRLWLFTNAYVSHARRVVRLLGVGEFFEGVTYCDYGSLPLVAKPHVEMFEKAEREACAVGEVGGNGVERGRESGSAGREFYFVDDSALNCRAARERGWKVVHKIEEGDKEPKHGMQWVRNLEDLQDIWPEFFEQKVEVNGADGKGTLTNGEKL